MRRVTNFNDYLFDKIFEAAENKETSIVLSDRLYNLLNDIKHPIAYDLAGFNEDNYMGDKATLIDYDETDKGKFTYTIPTKLIDYIEKEEPHYKDNLNFYSEMGRVIKNVPEVWNKYRNSTTIGRLVNKLFPDQYKPNGEPGKDIESFANLVKLERTKVENVFERFKVVEGADIVKYYSSTSYDSNSKNGSNLGSSCMRYDYCGNYIKFYSINKGVKLVILMSDTQEGKIVGRALLWDIEYIDGEKVDRKFMDRIYYVYEEDMMLYKEFAKKNEWLYKVRQTMYSDEKIHDTKIDSDDYMNLVTVSTFREHDEYPYMDTMKYFYHDDGYLSNSNDNGSDHYFLESTSGEYDGGGIYVEYYDERIPEDDLVYCELGDEYRYPDDASYIESEGEYATEWYIDRHFKYSDYENEYMRNDEATWSDFHDTYINEGDVIEVYKSGAAEVESMDICISKYRTEARHMDEIGSSCFEYRYKDEYYYFDESDEDSFIDVKSLKNNGLIISAHKVWDKDKIFRYNGKLYLDDAGPEKKDELIGQKRIF